MELMPQGVEADPGQGQVAVDPTVEAQGVRGLSSNNLGDELAASFHNAELNGVGGEALQAYHLSTVRDGDSQALLSADEANQQYGVKDMLTFDRPTTAAEAKYRQDLAIEKQNLAERSQTDGVFGKVGTTVASFIGGMADPVNAASSFIPVLGEERALSLAAKAGIESPLLKTALARTAQGAAGGTVGTLAMMPVSAFDQDYVDGKPFTVSEGLEDLAVNAAIGGALHTTFGFIGDGARRIFGNGVTDKESAAFQNAAEVTNAVMDPDTQANMKRAASSSLFDDTQPLGPSDVAEADAGYNNLQAKFELLPPEEERQFMVGDAGTHDYSNLSDSDFETFRKSLSKEVDAKTAEYDEREFSPKEMAEFSDLNNQYVSVEAERYRRSLASKPTGDIFRDALNFADSGYLPENYDPARPKDKVQRLKFALDEIGRRGGVSDDDIREGFDFLDSAKGRELLNNPDYAEVQTSKATRLKAWASYLYGSIASRNERLRTRSAQLQVEAGKRAKAKASDVSQVTTDSAKVDEVQREKDTGVTPPEPNDIDTDTATHIADLEDVSKWADAEAERIDPEGTKLYDQQRADTAEGREEAEGNSILDNVKQLYTAAANCILGE